MNKRAQSRFEIKISLFVYHVGDDSPDDSLAATGFIAFKPVLSHAAQIVRLIFLSECADY